ncbi:MAG: DUF1015 domain-containing protein [Candidatus Schekmanbacteria bacterium]|nr:DUF1015 domain-containing protein [Candidatus Schekmanbacteria bacterium]
MPEIKAFKGYVYNSSMVEPSKVVAPPYDVINSEEQDALYRLDPCNVVRLILGKENQGDSENNNKYTRAAAFLREWVDKGIITQQSESSIYLYEQEFTLPDGSRKVRKGFIALVKLDEPGKGSIFPHENTLAKPKEDRLNLMRACKGNLCQVFSLYTDSERKVDRLLEKGKPSKPVFDFIDPSGLVNRLWQVSSPEVIEEVRKTMAEKNLFIADGHHRYETAVNYRNEMRKSTGKNNGNEPFDYVTMMFVNTEDEGLVVLPIDRLIHSVKDFSSKNVLKKMGELFNITPVAEGTDAETLSKLVAEKGKETPSFGVALEGEKGYFIAGLKSRAVADSCFEPGFPVELKELDVSILHKLIFEKVLGIDEESLKNQTNIEYVKGGGLTIKHFKEGNYQAAFLLNPTPADGVKRVAEKGLKMPQKSTFFYPKLLSGIVFNLF